MAVNKARRIHDEAILVDGMGVAVLLPTALIPQPEWKGKPFLDRAIAAGVTSMNVCLGIQGIGMGEDRGPAHMKDMGEQELRIQPGGPLAVRVEPRDRRGHEPAGALAAGCGDGRHEIGRAHV